MQLNVTFLADVVRIMEQVEGRLTADLTCMTQ